MSTVAMDDRAIGGASRLSFGPARPPSTRSRGVIIAHLLVTATKLRMVNAERETLRLIARAPMRTVRAPGVAGVYAFPGPALAALARRGKMLEDFDGAPDAADDPAASAYCPRCHGRYLAHVQFCPDCLGLKLRTFS